MDISFSYPAPLYMRKAAGLQPPVRLSVAQATGTAPAAEMMDAASAEVAKSKNFCAVSLRAAPSFVTRTNGRCTR